MPKFSILGRLEASRIPAAVPPEFRARARFTALPGQSYTVILFAHDRTRSVSTSAQVRKALRRVPETESILAVGWDFTLEATSLLQHRDAAIVRKGEAGWTDESYNSLSG